MPYQPFKTKQGDRDPKSHAITGLSVYPLYQSVRMSVVVPFSPASLSPSLWVDAQNPASYALSGTTVTSIKDLSPNNYNLGSTTGGQWQVQPNLNGYNCFYNSNQSSGASLGKNASIALGTQVTAFMVNRNAGSGGYYGDMFDGVGSGNRFFFFGPTYYYNPVPGSASISASSGVKPSSIANIWTIASDVTTGSTTTTGYVDTTAYGGVATGAVSGGFTGLTIGCRYTLSAENWCGAIGELILYPYILSDTQRNQVISYLTAKWSIVPYVPPVNPFPATPYIWVDAQNTSSYVLSSGTAIANLIDLSPATNSLGTTSGSGWQLASSGINGHPTFQNWNGANAPAAQGRLGITNTSLGTSFTIFLVIQDRAQGGGTYYGDLIDGITTSPRPFMFGPNYFYNPVPGSAFSSSSNMNTASVWCVTSVTTGSGAATGYINGVVYGGPVAEGFVANFGSITIGSRWTNTAETWGGDIGEIAIFKSILNPTDIGTVTTYLKTKWSIP